LNSSQPNSGSKSAKQHPVGLRSDPASAAKLASLYGRWPASLLLKTPYMKTGHRTTVRIIRTTPPQNTRLRNSPFGAWNSPPKWRGSDHTTSVILPRATL
ncbi:MAG: hypothetical protein VYC98_17400, partial [Planctomycetota bacterium]|nr:hypothetical protein [Planctomycetota bacterium]